MKKVLPLIAIFSLLLVCFFLFTEGAPKTQLQPQMDEVLVLEETSLVFEPVANQDSLALRDSVVNFGIDLLGTPYVWAGCSEEGFDCSGFVFYVFKHFNVTVPRMSSLYADFGTTVSIDDVQMGDVLVFKSPSKDAIGHVGIVTKPNGMETEFMHSTSGKAKQVVISSLKLKGYKDRFIKAVDVLN
jgi:cell wall-associated NlpC family hydrolase